MPSMVALIDRNFTEMLAYYRTFSCDSTWSGHIEVQPRDVNPITIASFEALLIEISKQVGRGNKKLLIGMHGSENSLPYPVIAGTDVAADVEFLSLAKKAIEGDSTANNQLLSWTSEKTSQTVFQNSARLNRVLDVISLIRRAGIDHLEIRGCNIAAGDCLQALHSCLGSKYSVAPTVDFFSGSLLSSRQTNTTQQLLSRFSTLGPEKRIFSRTECLLPLSGASNADDPAFGMDWIRVSQHPTRYSSHAFAASHQAVEGWSKTLLEDSYYYPVGQRPPGGGFQRAGRLPIIGMWTPAGRKPFLFPGDGLDYLNTLGTQVSP
jgi:hypothetical protein